MYACAAVVDLNLLKLHRRQEPSFCSISTIHSGSLTSYTVAQKYSAPRDFSNEAGYCPSRGSGGGSRGEFDTQLCDNRRRLSSRQETSGHSPRGRITFTVGELIPSFPASRLEAPPMAPHWTSSQRSTRAREVVGFRSSVRYQTRRRTRSWCQPWLKCPDATPAGTDRRAHGCATRGRMRQGRLRGHRKSYESRGDAALKGVLLLGQRTSELAIDRAG